MGYPYISKRLWVTLLFSIKFKTRLNAGQFKMLTFCTEQHYFGVCELWFETFCHAEISTKDPLMEVDVALLPFDTFFVC